MSVVRSLLHNRLNSVQSAWGILIASFISMLRPICRAWAEVERIQPDFLIIDSIQTIMSPEISGVQGSVSQVREVTAELMQLAKTNNIAIFIVGHVTKEGTLAGPRMLEHMVDTVLYFEGERHHTFRILRAVKNRLDRPMRLESLRCSQVAWLRFSIQVKCFWKNAWMERLVRPSLWQWKEHVQFLRKCRPWWRRLCLEMLSVRRQGLISIVLAWFGCFGKTGWSLASKSGCLSPNQLVVSN